MQKTEAKRQNSEVRNQKSEIKGNSGSILLDDPESPEYKSEIFRSAQNDIKLEVVTASDLFGEATIAYLNRPDVVRYIKLNDEMYGFGDVEYFEWEAEGNTYKVAKRLLNGEDVFYAAKMPFGKEECADLIYDLDEMLNIKNNLSAICLMPGKTNLYSIGANIIGKEKIREAVKEDIARLNETLRIAAGAGLVVNINIEDYNGDVNQHLTFTIDN